MSDTSYTSDSSDSSGTSETSDTSDTSDIELVYGCRCKNCEEDTSGCRTKRRKSRHMAAVNKLWKLGTMPGEGITLVVGPAQVRIPCHKTLLSSFSGFFESSDVKVVANKAEMPHENPAVIRDFVQWLYCGTLNYTCSHYEEVRADELWVWGNKIRSPNFMQEAMHLFFAVMYRECLSAKTAEYVYANTQPGSILRRFVSDCIASRGPLLRLGEHSEDEYNSISSEWMQLLHRGGDLVTEHARIGFAQDNPAQPPWDWENMHKYSVEEKDTDKQASGNLGAAAQLSHLPALQTSQSTASKRRRSETSKSSTSTAVKRPRPGASESESMILIVRGILCQLPECDKVAEDRQITNCGHVFCKPCIRDWISLRGFKAVCPKCKRTLTGTTSRSQFTKTPSRFISTGYKSLTSASADLSPATTR